MKDPNLNQNSLLEEKCNILADIIIAMRPIHSEASERQKAYIETIIGAAIWYIPKSSSAWTGYISVGALKTFLPSSGVDNPKLSEEHVYPRKIVARELLKDIQLDRGRMVNAFVKKYGQIHLITPEENKFVRRYQRVSEFNTPEIAYEYAKIELVKIDKNELTKIKKRDIDTIKLCLERSC